jgi:hypothetical protein
MTADVRPTQPVIEAPDTGFATMNLSGFNPDARSDEFSIDKNRVFSRSFVQRPWQGQRRLTF